MGEVLNPVSPFKHDYFKDNWVWDNQNKSSRVILSRSHKAAYFHTDPVTESQGTAGVRGTRGFVDGEHYWEIEFLEPLIGKSVMVGVGNKQALLELDDYRYVDLLGMDENSWGLSYKGFTWHGGQYRRYCDPFYDQSTVIGVHLNLYNKTLTFYMNGEKLGTAFTNVNAGDGLYPLISSTAPNTEMEVGVRTCRYLSLQEQCCLLVANHVQKKEMISNLPLPSIVKEHIMCFT